MTVNQRDVVVPWILAVIVPSNEAFVPIHHRALRQSTHRLNLSEDDDPMSAYDRAMRGQQGETSAVSSPPLMASSEEVASSETPWEKLAMEWSSVNANADEGLIKNYAEVNGVADASFFSDLEDMTKEVEAMGEEVESTFRQLENMESEIFNMVSTLRTDKEEYEATIKSLEQESSIVKAELQGQLAKIQQEYNEFRARVAEENRVERESAQATQAQLQAEIQSMQSQIQAKIQDVKAQESKAQEFLGAKQELEQELTNLQTESTDMIDEFRTKFFEERDQRYQEVKGMQSQLEKLQLTTRDVLEEAIAEGRANLDREWVDYVFQLMTQEERNAATEKDLSSANKQLADKDQQLADLQAHSAYMEQLANGSLGLLNEIHGAAVGSSLPVENMDLPTIKAKVADLISNLEAKDADYREVMGRMQSNYDGKIAGLQTQMQDLVEEYERYKSKSSEDQQRELEKAKSAKMRLQKEIGELQLQLKEQIDSTKAEAEMADKFLERQLSEATEDKEEVDKFKALFEAEREARLKEQKEAYDRYQELFKAGRKWVIEARRDGLEAYNRLKQTAAGDIEARNKQVQDTLSLLSVAIGTIVSLLVLIPVLFELPQLRDTKPPPPMIVKTVDDSRPQLNIPRVLPELRKANIPDGGAIQKLESVTPATPQKVEAKDSKDIKVSPQQAEATAKLTESTEKLKEKIETKSPLETKNAKAKVAEETRPQLEMPKVLATLKRLGTPDVENVEPVAPTAQPKTEGNGGNTKTTPPALPETKAQSTVSAEKPREKAEEPATERKATAVASPEKVVLPSSKEDSFKLGPPTAPAINAVPMPTIQDQILSETKENVVKKQEPAKTPDVASPKVSAPTPESPKVSAPTPETVTSPPVSQSPADKLQSTAKDETAKPEAADKTSGPSLLEKLLPGSQEDATKQAPSSDSKSETSSPSLLEQIFSSPKEESTKKKDDQKEARPTPKQESAQQKVDTTQKTPPSVPEKGDKTKDDLAPSTKETKAQAEKASAEKSAAADPKAPAPKDVSNEKPPLKSDTASSKTPLAKTDDKSSESSNTKIPNSRPEDVMKRLGTYPSQRRPIDE